MPALDDERTSTSTARTAPSRQDTSGVSVVIPTTGRPEVVRALDSVRAQDCAVSVQIVVVFNGPGVEQSSAYRQLRVEPDIEVVVAREAVGGSGARNLGVRAATNEWIAFLDDDDLWAPDKLSSQLASAAALRAGGRLAVVTTRVAQRIAGVEQPVRNVPARMFDGSEDVARYLFLNRRPGVLRPSIFTSTLLVDARLCREVPWDEGLPRHQDWDWLLRASKHAGFSLSHLPAELATIHVGTPNSISASAEWERSFDWAVRMLPERGDDVLVDFLFAQTLRYALHARDIRGVRAVVSESWRRRRRPHIGPVVSGMAGTIPRRKLQLMLRWFR